MNFGPSWITMKRLSTLWTQFYQITDLFNSQEQHHSLTPVLNIQFSFM
jgi:hypothetical protein